MGKRELQALLAKEEDCVYVPNLSDVFDCPIQSSTGHGAERPEREYLVEAVVNELYASCEGGGGGHPMLQVVHSRDTFYVK